MTPTTPRGTFAPRPLTFDPCDLHPPGSEEERRAVSTATSHGSRPRNRGGPSSGEVTVTVGAGPAVAGAELELRAVARNEGAEPRTLRLRLSLCAVRYTGVSGAPFRQEQHRRTIPPGQGETWTPGSPRGQPHGHLGHLGDNPMDTRSPPNIWVPSVPLVPKGNVDPEVVLGLCGPPGWPGHQGPAQKMGP